MQRGYEQKSKWLCPVFRFRFNQELATGDLAHNKPLLGPRGWPFSGHLLRSVRRRCRQAALTSSSLLASQTRFVSTHTSYEPMRRHHASPWMSLPWPAGPLWPTSSPLSPQGTACAFAAPPSFRVLAMQTDFGCKIQKNQTDCLGNSKKGARVYPFINFF